MRSAWGFSWGPVLAGWHNTAKGQRSEGSRLRRGSRKAHTQVTAAANGLVRRAARKPGARCRLWIVVAASNDSGNDVATLSRGRLSTADVERLLTATNANVVEELRAFPETLGILAEVLDARILHLPLVTELAVARRRGDERLQNLMAAKGLSTATDRTADEKMRKCSLARSFGDEPSTRTRGSRPNAATQQRFRTLAGVASDNDVALNKAVAESLLGLNLLSGYSLEANLGTAWCAERPYSPKPTADPCGSR